MRGILVMLALAAVYLAIARAGLLFSLPRHSISPVWPASGVTLVALLTLGVSRWPAISLGALLTALSMDVPPLASLGIAAGNTLEAVLGVLLLRRLGFSDRLERVQDVVALVVGVALGCTLVSTLMGTLSLALAGILTWTEVARVAWVWWGGSATGIVVVAPVLLFLRRWQPVERRVEAVVLGLCTLVVCLEVFEGGLLDPPTRYIETFLFFPLAVWAALRFGARGVAFTTLLMTVLCVWGTELHLGPFSEQSEDRALLLVQLFIAINATTGLLLAAVSAGRQHAVGRLELLATAVRGVGEGIVISEVTPAGPRVVFVNEAFRALVGLGLVELIGRPARELAGEMDPEARQQLEAALREAWPFRGHVLLKHRYGTRVHSEMQLSPVRGADGRVTHLVAIYRDITATQELRARLLAAERVAAVGTLTAGIGHEIQNPLAYLELNLDGAVRTLRKGTAGVADALAHLQDAKEGAERIRLIVQDLRTFSRQDGEERELVDLREVATPALRMVRHLGRERARLVEEYGPVPLVQGSEARLGQVLLNLLANAMQAIPEGEAERHMVRIRTGTTPEGLAQVEVADTGRGIAPEVLPHIFEPFFTTRAGEDGTGLGLSICQQIVRAHGGEIQVRSEPGKGSTFTVLLPAAPEAAVHAAELEPQREEPAPCPGGAARRGRILVVDDEPRLAQSIRMLLEPVHDVVTTTRGSEALELVSSGQRFDLVVCDLQMPGTTGMDIYARLSEQEPELARRLVFMSGGSYSRAATDFLRTVSNRVLQKPVRPEVLLATIDAALTPAPPPASP